MNSVHEQDSSVENAMLLGAAISRVGTGLLYHQRGDFRRAEQTYRNALENDPGDREASFLLGLLLFQQQRFAEAAERLTLGVMDDDVNPDRHDMLGEAWKAQGNLEQAAAAYSRALEIEPGFEPARIHLGYVRLKNREYESAAIVFNEALHCNPGNVDACLGMACTCSETFQYEPALKLYTLAHDLDPASYVPLYGMGQALAGLGRYAEAESMFRLALERAPGNSSLESNLGAVLKEQGKMAESYRFYTAALTHNPDNSAAAFGLGGWYWLNHQFEEALYWHERAIAVEPEAASAHANLSMLLLLKGDFHRGWKEYEWRFKISDPKQNIDKRVFAKPLWDGSSFEGETLFVTSEQGAGDMIQFCRYLPMVKARGGTVLLECAPRLMRMFRGLPGVDRMIPKVENSAVPFDLYTPLLSIPRFFSDTEQQIPSRVPYLAAEPALVEEMRERVDGEGFKVGLCWQGNRTYKHDANRSIPFQELFPLLDVPGIVFYSLQKGDGSDGLESLPSSRMVMDLGACLDNGPDGFIETAAAMQHLDLIVSSDTAVPHLAGALGRPVWVMLAHTPEWRWMLERPDSPWYPTMRLFRQQAPGDWRSVVEAVKTELLNLIASKVPA